MMTLVMAHQESESASVVADVPTQPELHRLVSHWECAVCGAWVELHSFGMPLSRNFRLAQYDVFRVEAQPCG
jgi:hypothetical protein